MMDKSKRPTNKRVNNKLTQPISLPFQDNLDNCNSICATIFEQYNLNQVVAKRRLTTTTTTNTISSTNKQTNQITTTTNDTNQPPNTDQPSSSSSSSSPAAATNNTNKLPTSSDHFTTSPDQYSLIEIKDINKLKALLTHNNILPPSNNWSWGFYHHIDRAILHIQLADKNYQNIHDYIKQANDQGQWQKNLPKNLYLEIENLWNEATYKIICPTKSFSQLKHYQLHRMRHRLPCPLTNWVGGRKHGVSYEASRILKNYIKYNQTGVRIEKQTNQTLSQQTGLNMKTVRNWFKNRRSKRQQQRQQQRDSKIIIKQSPSSHHNNNNYHQHNTNQSYTNKTNQTDINTTTDIISNQNFLQEPCHHELTLYTDPSHEL